MINIQPFIINSNTNLSIRIFFKSFIWDKIIWKYEIIFRKDFDNSDSIYESLCDNIWEILFKLWLSEEEDEERLLQCFREVCYKIQKQTESKSEWREKPLEIKKEVIPEEVQDAIEISKKAMDYQKRIAEMTIEIQKDKNDYIKKHWTFIEKTINFLK